MGNKELMEKLNALGDNIAVSLSPGSLLDAQIQDDELPDAVIYTIRYLCVGTEQSWVIWSGIDDDLAVQYIENNWGHTHGSLGDGGDAYFQILYTPVNSDRVSEHKTFVVVSDELFVNV